MILYNSVWHLNWYVLSPTHLVYMHCAQWHKEQLVEQDVVYCLQNAWTSQWPVSGEAGTMYESIRHSHMYSHYVPLLRPLCYWLPLLGPLEEAYLHCLFGSWPLHQGPSLLGPPEGPHLPPRLGPRHLASTSPWLLLPRPCHRCLRILLYPWPATRLQPRLIWPQSACITTGRSLVFFHFFRRILYSVRAVRQTTWKQI